MRTTSAPSGATESTSTDIVPSPPLESDTLPAPLAVSTPPLMPLNSYDVMPFSETLNAYSRWRSGFAGAAVGGGVWAVRTADRASVRAMRGAYHGSNFGVRVCAVPVCARQNAGRAISWAALSGGAFWRSTCDPAAMRPPFRKSFVAPNNSTPGRIVFSEYRDTAERGVITGANGGVRVRAPSMDAGPSRQRGAHCLRAAI